MEQSVITEGADAVRSVLVIDDHPLFRDALAMTLHAALGLNTTLTADTLTGALRRLSRNFEPDAIFLDLNLPDVTGFDGLLRLKAAAPGIPVIVVSALGDNSIIYGVLKAGAVGFIRKDATRETLVDAFRRIWAGDIYTPDDYSPPPRSRFGGSSPDSVVDKLSSLTKQQMRILDLVCEGQLNKQIAYELSIAETTVKTHLTAILRKLGAQSRTQAALLANEARQLFKTK